MLVSWLKPVLLAVDDDPAVLSAVERDLRTHYRDRYRVLTAGSGAAALGLLEKIRRRNETVALFLVDHRMPHMTGIEFLARAVKDFGDAKRVLLTAYADTDAAIRAINEIKLNHYLLKPWDPPEQHLYPVLDELLEDWQASYRPPFEGIRVLGTRWSPRSYELREFLARNQVPYQWLDVETADRDPEVKTALDTVSPEERHFPLVLFPDGTLLPESRPGDVAARVGLHMRAEVDVCDVVVVGGGPAGLAAAVYGASEGLRTVVVEREAPGGQAGLSARIENYLGFPSGVSGADLTRRAVAQAKRFGADILAPQEAVTRACRGPLPHRQAHRRLRAFLPGPADRHRRAVAEAGRARHRPLAGRRRLLRRGSARSGRVPRRGRVHRRRRQLRRAGRHELRALRAPRGHPVPRRIARRQHVAIPHR